MKHFYKKFLTLSFSSSLLFALSLQGQTLSGTKTIGTGGDYATINAAVFALTSSVVTGPVIFKIKPGTYNEKIAIPRIASASATRTITFTSESGNAADVIITNTAADNADDVSSFTIHLNGSNYVILDKLTIRAAGTVKGVCVLMNTEAIYNRIQNCILKLDTSFIPGSSHALFGIRSYTKGSGQVGNHFNASFNIIDNNTIIGGMYGIRLQGASVFSLPHDIGNIVRNNTVLQSYNTGIHTEYNDLEDVSGNRIILRPFTQISKGIEITESDTDFTVTRNYVEGAQGDGIAVKNSLGITRILIANNMVICNIDNNHTGNGSGITVGACNKARVYHNSVLILGSKADSRALYYSGPSTIGNVNVNNADNVIANNILANMAGGYVYYWTDETDDGLTQSDYNILYTIGNTLGKCGDASYGFEAFKTATGTEANSITIDPVFFSNTDLHTVNPQVDSTGIPLADVTTDFDGQTRNLTKPDVGADEFVISGVDIALVNCSPDVLGLGNNVITATLRNNGIKSLKDSVISLSYSMDNGVTWSVPETYQIKGLTIFNSSESVTFTTPFNIAVKQAYQLCVRINGQGLLSDVNKVNELICKNLCVGLRGTYTIGGANPDFQMLSDAIDSLSSCGAGGPVIFNIRPGIYQERVIVPEIKGTNLVNTVTIRPETGNKADVILRDATGYDPNTFAILRLIGSDHFIIEDLTFEETDAVNYSACVQLGEGADHNIIRNCMMLTDTVRTGYQGIFGILFSERQPSNPVGATKASYNLIENNTIIGAIEGICLYGQGTSIYCSGNIVRNNTLRLAQRTAIMLRSQANFEVSGNYVYLRKDGDGDYGIDLTNVSDFTVNANYIYRAGYAGIHMQDAESSITSVVSNNIIAGGFKESYVRALACFDCSKLDILHNSVIADKNVSGNSVLGFVGTNDNVRVRNNIFYNKVGGYVYDLQDTSGISIDYNLVYTSGTYAKWNYSEKSTLADLQAEGVDVNSSSFIPVFRSDTDLHVTNTALAGLALSLPEVPKDIDGDLRSLTAPFLGADEFLQFDLQAIGVLPEVAKPGTNTVSLTLQNRGFGSLKDSVIRLSYSTDNGVSWTNPQAFTIKDLTGLNTTETFSFSQPWTISSTGNFTLCARIEPPGFLPDPNKDNDKICTDVCVGSAGGTFTVGGSGADFPSITAAVNSLSAACGIGGPYVFNLLPGIYTERISIPQLNGASLQNTVTFQSQSGNAADVIIRSAGGHTAADHHTLQLAGADYVIFRNLTIKNTAEDYASAIHFTAGATNNIIQSCIIEADSTGVVSADVCAIRGEQPLLSLLMNSNNKIVNNRISGGYAGIFWTGSEAKRDIWNEFSNNRISAAYFKGIDISAQENILVEQNKIFMRSDHENSVGIFYEKGRGNGSISRNYTAYAGASGIQLDDVDAADSVIVSNNMIAGGFSTTIFGAGIYTINSSKVHFYHNSVIYDKSGSGISAAFYAEISEELKVVNNIFYNKGNGYAYFVDAGGTVGYSDYNDLFSAGTDFAFWGQDAGDLTALRNLSGMDASSLSLIPAYKSDYDLHLIDVNLDGEGTSIPAVPVDYDGQQRHSLSPDIGADEFTIGKDGGVISFYSPSGPVTVNESSPIKITVSNYGNVALSNFTVSYSINGGTPVSENITVSIPVGGTLSHEFTTQWTPTATGTFSLCSRTIITGDIDNTNDEFCKDFEVADLPDTLDAGITSFTAPSGLIYTGSSNTVKVQVKNLGNVTLNNFPVVLVVNGQVKATDNFSLSLLPGATAEHTFSQAFEPLVAGSYELKAYTALPGDQSFSNDTSFYTIDVFPVGVEEHTQGTISVYPNPAYEQLIIRFDKPVDAAWLSVYNSLGQLVETIRITATNQVQINVSAWPEGMYLLRLDASEGTGKSLNFIKSK